jgi:hypothetical protein
MTSFLDNLTLLQSLTQQDRDNLSIFCQERHIKKWELLFTEWDEWNAMYFLQRWKIDIFKKINWEEVKLWQVVAEEILWEMALFQSINSTRMATAISSEDCNLVVIPNFSIEQLKTKQPEVIEKIKQIIEYRNMQNKYISK